MWQRCNYFIYRATPSSCDHVICKTAPRAAGLFLAPLRFSTLLCFLIFHLSTAEADRTFGGFEVRGSSTAHQWSHHARRHHKRKEYSANPQESTSSFSGPWYYSNITCEDRRRKYSRNEQSKRPRIALRWCGAWSVDASHNLLSNLKAISSTYGQHWCHRRTELSKFLFFFTNTTAQDLQGGKSFVRTPHGELARRIVFQQGQWCTHTSNPRKCAFVFKTSPYVGANPCDREILKRRRNASATLHGETIPPGSSSSVVVNDGNRLNSSCCRPQCRGTVLRAGLTIMQQQLFDAPTSVPTWPTGGHDCKREWRKILWRANSFRQAKGPALNAESAGSHSMTARSAAPYTDSISAAAAHTAVALASAAAAGSRPPLSDEGRPLTTLRQHYLRSRYRQSNYNRPSEPFAVALTPPVLLGRREERAVERTSSERVDVTAITTEKLSGRVITKSATGRFCTQHRSPHVATLTTTATSPVRDNSDGPLSILKVTKNTSITEELRIEESNCVKPRCADVCALPCSSSVEEVRNCRNSSPDDREQRNDLRSADDPPPLRGNEDPEAEENPDTIYALSSMGDVAEFSPAAIAVWRISGPLAFLVLRLLMAKPRPQSLQQEQHQRGHHPEPIECPQQIIACSERESHVGRGEQQQKQQTGQQPYRHQEAGEEIQRAEKPWNHGFELDREKRRERREYRQPVHTPGKMVSRQVLKSCTVPLQVPKICTDVTKNQNEDKQLPLLLRPLPAERVATFVKAWDCLDFFWHTLGDAGSLASARATIDGATTKLVGAPSAVPLDDIVVLRFNKPRSFTGENMVEVHSHGSRAAVRALRQFFMRVTELIECVKQQQQEEADELQELLLEEEKGQMEDDEEEDGWPIGDSHKEAPSSLEDVYTLFLQQQLRHSSLPPAHFLAEPTSKRVHSIGFEDRAQSTSVDINDFHTFPPSSHHSTEALDYSNSDESCCSDTSVLAREEKDVFLNKRRRSASQKWRSQSQQWQQLLEAVNTVWIEMQAEKGDDKGPHQKPQKSSRLPGKFRLATRGEFSLRAFLNGKLKDIHAFRALAALVTAESTEQHRGALKQLRKPSQQVQHQMRSWQRRLQEALALLEGCLQIGDDAAIADSGIASVWAPQRAGKLIEEVLLHMEQHHALLSREREATRGLKVVICGPPNAGKSTLFNALVGRDAAIVSRQAGTTRDVLSSSLPLLHGRKALLFDTAGLHGHQEPQQRQVHQYAVPDGNMRKAQSLVHQQSANMLLTGKEQHDEKPIQQENTWSRDPVEQEGMVRAVRTAEAADVLLLMMEAHSSPQVTIDACRSFLRCFAAAVRGAGPLVTSAASIPPTRLKVSRAEPPCGGGDVGVFQKSSFEQPLCTPSPTTETMISCRKEDNDNNNVPLLPRVRRLYVLLNKAERFLDKDASSTSFTESIRQASTDAYPQCGSIVSAFESPSFAAEAAPAAFSSTSSSSRIDGHPTFTALADPAVIHCVGSSGADGGTDVIRPPISGFIKDNSMGTPADDVLSAGGCDAETAPAPGVAASTLATLSRIVSEELPVSLLARVVPLTRLTAADGQATNSPHTGTMSADVSASHKASSAPLVFPLSARCGWNLPLLIHMLEGEANNTQQLQQQQEKSMTFLRQSGGHHLVATTRASLATDTEALIEHAAAGAEHDVALNCGRLLWKEGGPTSGTTNDASPQTYIRAHSGSSESADAVEEGNISGDFLMGTEEVLGLLGSGAAALRRCLKVPGTFIEEKAEELREALKCLQHLTGDIDTGGRQAVIATLLDTFCLGK